MEKLQFIIGIVFLVLGIVISLFVNDLRAFYSGGFFIILGVWVIIRTIRKSKSKSADEKE